MAYVRRVPIDLDSETVAFISASPDFGEDGGMHFDVEGSKRVVSRNFMDRPRLDRLIGALVSAREVLEEGKEVGAVSLEGGRA